MYMYIYTYIHIYLFVDLYLCIYIYICLYIDVCRCIYVSVYVDTYNTRPLLDHCFCHPSCWLFHFDPSPIPTSWKMGWNRFPYAYHDPPMFSLFQVPQRILKKVPLVIISYGLLWCFNVFSYGLISSTNQDHVFWRRPRNVSARAERQSHCWSRCDWDRS